MRLRQSISHVWPSERSTNVHKRRHFRPQFALPPSSTARGVSAKDGCEEPVHAQEAAVAEGQQLGEVHRPPDEEGGHARARAQRPNLLVLALWEKEI